MHDSLFYPDLSRDYACATEVDPISWTTLWFRKVRVPPPVAQQPPGGIIFHCMASAKIGFSVAGFCDIAPKPSPFGAPDSTLVSVPTQGTILLEHPSPQSQRAILNEPCEAWPRSIFLRSTCIEGFLALAIPKESRPQSPLSLGPVQPSRMVGLL